MCIDSVIATYVASWQQFCHFESEQLDLLV